MTKTLIQSVSFEKKYHNTKNGFMALIHFVINVTIITKATRATENMAMNIIVLGESGCLVELVMVRCAICTNVISSAGHRSVVIGCVVGTAAGAAAAEVDAGKMVCMSSAGRT